jgi:hypothetical protein
MEERRMRIVILFYIIFILTDFNSNVLAEEKGEKKPFATFVMIHLEAGGDSKFRIFQDILREKLKPEYVINNRSLAYQKALWPTVIKLVQLADKYDFKLSLTLNPQWAEYILKDNQKIEHVSKWVHNGHELAFHHHGINHIDWNGYSNRFKNNHFKNREDKFTKKLDSDSYRGSVKQGFDQLKQLVSKIDRSYKVQTGCITDTAIDKPREVSILTRGSIVFEKDFISKPEAMQLPNGEKIYWLNHYQLRSNFNTAKNPNSYSDKQNWKKSKEELEKIKENYNTARHDEVVGIVFHAFDYYRAPQLYASLFKYLSSKNQRVETIRTVLKQYTDTFHVEIKALRRPSHGPSFKAMRQMR